jgi:hypothetical protein
MTQKRKASTPEDELKESLDHLVTEAKERLGDFENELREHHERAAGLLKRFTWLYVANGAQRINGVRAGDLDLAQITTTDVPAAADVAEQSGFGGRRATLALTQHQFFMRATNAPLDDVGPLPDVPGEEEAGSKTCGERKRIIVGRHDKSVRNCGEKTRRRDIPTGRPYVRQIEQRGCSRTSNEAELDRSSKPSCLSCIESPTPLQIRRYRARSEPEGHAEKLSNHKQESSLWRSQRGMGLDLT